MGRESGHGKASIYIQDNINAEQTHTDIHAMSGIRTHDPNVLAGEHSSCLRLRGHCDRFTLDV
jgi:hypothetical protein